MSYKINENCASCGACAAECPNNAISEGDDKYEIDPSKCSECVGFFDTPQCGDVCPCEAACYDESSKETEEQLKAKLKRMYPDKDFSGNVPSHFAK